MSAPRICNLAALSEEAFPLRDITHPQNYLMMVRDIYFRALEAVGPLFEEVAPLATPLARLQLTITPDVTIADTAAGPLLRVPACGLFHTLREQGCPPFSIQASIETAILVQALCHPTQELAGRHFGWLRLYEALELIRISLICERACRNSVVDVGRLLLAPGKLGRQAHISSVADTLGRAQTHPLCALVAAMLSGPGFFTPHRDALCRWAPEVLEVLDELDVGPDSSLNAIYRWEALGLGLPTDEQMPQYEVLPHPILHRLIKVGRDSVGAC